jgi:hypothetical protein
MPSRIVPLAIKICREVARLQASRRNIWISISDLNVGASNDDIESAVALAAGRNWLLVGGQPAHSVVLTEEGWKIVTRS